MSPFITSAHHMKNIKIQVQQLAVLATFLISSQLCSMASNLSFSGMVKAEQFYAQNYSLLNDNAYHIDRIWYARTITDLSVNSFTDHVEFNMTVRNKYCPGIPGSVGKTNNADVKLADIVFGPHSHTLPLQLFWMREGWMSFDITAISGLDFVGQHSFKIGAFPFELGRGIALGSAYAVGPEVLGFYTDSAIDQYAYGALFSGDIVSGVLTYDLYASILQNKSGTLGDTGLKIYGQEVGRIGRAERGFGKINFIIAGRGIWTVLDTPNFGKLSLEPYAVYNSDPEQKVEFFADASSKLGTVGCAGEYKGNRFEMGFDSAINLGYQRVRGWDRNTVTVENRDGSLVTINSHVTEANSLGGSSNKALFVSQAQTIINDAAQGESHNAQVIGSYQDPLNVLNTKTLTNAVNRFRDAYTNTYNGWMFVIDGLVYLSQKDLSLATEVGVSSGDNNPNIDTQDRCYSGFIGLQELYSGKRVRSAFVLGGAGKLPRPLSQPLSKQAPTPFSNVVSGLNNLVFGGVSLKWKPQRKHHQCTVHPNIIAYFQHFQTKAFDAFTGKELNCDASPHLGVEANMFFDYIPFDSVKIYGVASLFVPGQHYTDIKGKPLNKDQQKALDILDRTGFDKDKIPGLGDNTAFTFNIGIQYNF